MYLWGVLISLIVILIIFIIKEIGKCIKIQLEYENSLNDKDFRNFKIYQRRLLWGIKNEDKK